MLLVESTKDVNNRPWHFVTIRVVYGFAAVVITIDVCLQFIDVEQPKQISFRTSCKEPFTGSHHCCPLPFF